MRDILITFVLLYVAAAVVAHLVADRMIFLPPAPSYGPDEPALTFVPASSGERLAALHLPHPVAVYTVLYSHGNAEDLGHVAPYLEELRERGFAVLGYDYRGYGASSGGPPTTRKASEDLESVYRYATTELGIAPERIVLFGRSVGAGPATELAARERAGGLILESAFVSAYRVITRVPLLPGDRFSNLSNIRKVTAPVLVIHGRDDGVIPFRHGERLYEAAGEPKRRLWVDGADHNDLDRVGGAAYWRAIEEFRSLLEEGEEPGGWRDDGSGEARD